MKGKPNIFFSFLLIFMAHLHNQYICLLETYFFLLGTNYKTRQEEYIKSCPFYVFSSEGLKAK